MDMNEPTVGRLVNLFRVAALAAVLLGGTALAAAWLGNHPLVSAAFAEDDGGGDDGGGGDGGGDDGGGGSGDSSGAESESESESESEDESEVESEVGVEGSTSSSAGSGLASHEAGNGRVVDNELVVASGDRNFVAAVLAMGYSVVEQTPLKALDMSVSRLQIPAGEDLAAARAKIEAAFPDAIVDFHGLYDLSGQASLPVPGFARALIGWGETTSDCGHGLRIGLVDAAVDSTLPALAAAKITHRRFLSSDVPSAPTDHGSAVAAILVAGAERDGGPTGLLPGADLYAAEAFTVDAEGRPAASVVGVVAALDWFAVEGVRVVNLSLTGADNKLLHLAVQRASALGMVLVAAAGNNGPSAGPVYPAAYKEVVAVAAVDSARQPFKDGNQGEYVDFAAPGVGVWAAAPAGGGFYTGSSFAAPFVTAAVGTRLVAGMTDEDVVGGLKTNAIDLAPLGRDPIFGVGLVQAMPACGAMATAQ
jgi:hypothetical protein